MSKLRSDDNSSLELLLDTMCNTFGAVMFIAISLLIVISMLGRVTAVSERLPEMEQLNVMQEQLKQLEAEYAHSRKMLDLLKPFAARLQNDPRREILERCLKLKGANVLLENQLKIQLLQKETAENLNKILLKKKNELDAVVKQKKEESEPLEKKLAALKEAVLFVSNSLATLKPESSLVFKHLQENEDAPYYIILRHGRLWRIGPDLEQDQVRVHPDVSSVKKENTYVCTPVAAGTAVWDGKSNEPSAEAADLIRQIPEGRFPSFQIYPDSAREMFLIREALKKWNIRHAFTTYTDEKFPGFVLLTGNDKKYETD